MSKQPTRFDEVIDPKLLGNLLEAVPPQAPPPGLRAKVLARALGPNVLADIKTDNKTPSMRELLPEENPATNTTYTASESASDNLEQDRFAILNNSTPLERYVDPVMLLFDLDTERTRDILNKAATRNSDSFEPSGIPGTQLFYFKGGPRTANATCGIVKIAAGAVFPAHEHQGEEHVIILQGSATEQSGRSFHAGDAINCQKGTRHSFRAHDDCPLVFAVLLEKPNKWLLGQIVLDFVFGRRRFVSKDRP